jgi:hypothetical protein
MVDAERARLHLIKNEGSVKNAPRHLNTGSAVVLEAKHGQIRQNALRVLNREDADALLSGLAMAIVQVLHAQQSL